MLGTYLPIILLLLIAVALVRLGRCLVAGQKNSARSAGSL